MLRILTLATCLALSTASLARAHSEGHGSIEPAEALVSAVNAADTLTRTNVDRDWSPLDPSFARLTTQSARILAIVDGDYVVAVTNPEGRIFYILIAYNGTVIDANFTGTFPYVYDAQDPSTWTTD